MATTLKLFHASKLYSGANKLARSVTDIHFYPSLMSALKIGASFWELHSRGEFPVLQVILDDMKLGVLLTNALAYWAQRCFIV